MRNKSFTLIELLVVIVIIGILAGVIIVSTSSSINKANFAKAQAFSNTVQQELLLNLVSEWTFDNESKLGEDTWGNYDGTLNGEPQLKTKGECVHGTCLFFDGIDDYIFLNKTVSLTYNNFTISWWMKKSLSRYESLFSNYPGATCGHVELRTNNEIRFEGSTNEVYTRFMPTNLVISDGKWHNYFLSSSPTDFKLYVDGVETFNSTPNTDAVNQTFNYIGLEQSQITYIYGKYFTGTLDDVRIYNSALSTSQIKQEYVAGLNSLLANGSVSKEEYDQRLNNLASK